ncbi:CPBP family intramembrane glutamic endopeptidase [Alkaliphilus metalliredigens]|uniref:CPBP family intramembrane glutamic endopeptidase n=1 Tax=Alkaliphilus metalliredigens TaxID=208226 RepID=UPI001A98B845|nr:CPBP family intramembrane glutamic endopeptidase [Alkaliphilus metalliredigens]
MSKVIGFIIVILFVKMIGDNLSSIGFNVNNKWSIFILGGVITSALMILGYGGEFLIFASDSPQLLIAAIDPKAGVTGGISFALFLLFGNAINCFMEEGLFRGIMIPMLNRKYSVGMAIFLQALLFGIWHIPWAFKWYISGMVSGSGGFIMALVINFIPMILIGIVFGVMYYYTNSIWTPWISHFIINSILNLVHVSINGELNVGMTIRMSIFQSTIFILIPVLIILTKKLNKVRVEHISRINV